MSKTFFIFILSGLLSINLVNGQSDVEVDSTEFDIFGDTEIGFSLINEIPLTLNMEKEMELSAEAKDAQKKKEVRRKKKYFYGLKTKKGFTRKGTGEKVDLEVFHYLKDFKETDPYIPEIYWFDMNRKSIRNTGKIDAKKGVILHGPYKRTIGEQVVEEGIFYKGAKHGRWTKFDRQDILTEKSKYYKGWPKYSKVKHYDEKQTKLKEVLPFVYGKKNGTYYYFHENGTIAIKGEYKEDVKVGLWTEYYPFRRRKKKEIQYPSNPYDTVYQPFISKEWDRQNRLVYQRKL
jgi:antitoxin component YwqK of YwqJK toxin-antitoxin module